MNFANFRLDNRVAVVTGASGILGKHFCKGLLDIGASVAAMDIDPKLESTCKELSSFGKIRAFPLDVSDKESVDRSLAWVLGEFGKVDVLHNNAASKSSNISDFFAPTEKYSPEVWREVMAVNLDGMFFMAQTYGEHMVKNGSGSIIQTSSIYGQLGPDQRIYEGSEYLGNKINTPAVYSASKAGVVGLTRYLATLWGQHGVRVNTLVPGGVRSGQNEEFVEKYSSRVPLGRMAEAHEMVGALLFLASDCSSYITGQTITVDGGLSCW